MLCARMCYQAEGRWENIQIYVCSTRGVISIFAKAQDCATRVCVCFFLIFLDMGLGSVLARCLLSHAYVNHFMLLFMLGQTQTTYGKCGSDTTHSACTLEHKSSDDDGKKTDRPHVRVCVCGTGRSAHQTHTHIKIRINAARRQNARALAAHTMPGVFMSYLHQLLLWRFYMRGDRMGLDVEGGVGCTENKQLAPAPPKTLPENRPMCSGSSRAPPVH